MSPRRQGDDAPALSEEAAALLRVILERQAYRQLMVANIRGHGLKFVQSVEEKLQLGEDLSRTLRIYRETERLYQKLGGEDLHLAVRSKMDRIPYPSSRLELAICLVLCDMAEQVAGETYLESASPEFAAIARSLVDMARSNTRTGGDLFLEYCRAPENRPHAQQLLERWLVITLKSLGRPGTSGDARAVTLGLRSRGCADSTAEFLARLERFLQPSGFVLPDLAGLGLEMPSERHRAR